MVTNRVQSGKPSQDLEYYLRVNDKVDLQKVAPFVLPTVELPMFVHVCATKHYDSIVNIADATKTLLKVPADTEVIICSYVWCQDGDGNLDWLWVNLDSSKIGLLKGTKRAEHYVDGLSWNENVSNVPVLYLDRTANQTNYTDHDTYLPLPPYAKVEVRYDFASSGDDIYATFLLLVRRVGS